MARARNIKPSFFSNEQLGELPFEGRLLFIGLWTLADREGRLEDRPKRIKAELFPYDPGVNVDTLLDALASGEEPFIVRYSLGDKDYIQVSNFAKHQRPHSKEAESTIPGHGEHPPRSVPAPYKHQPRQVLARPDTPILIPDTGYPHPDTGLLNADTPNPIPEEGAIAPCREDPTMEATNEIVGFLNATVGTNYRASSKKTHQHIQARLREGYTPDDFRTVILRKNADWGNDPNMAKYLRPETLFGSKFESYLNQPDRGPPQSAHDVLTALYYEARGEEDHDP